MSNFDIDIEYTAPDLSFRLAARIAWQATMTAVVGPSGAGKSTFLELILGLRDQKRLRGYIRVGPQTVFDSKRDINTPIWHRGFGWVPQSASLFPHLSVAENLRFAMNSSEKWDELVEVLDLRPLLSRLPQHLSGGEQQRVALGRAILSGCTLLFLDEPFSHLDRPRRELLSAMLRRLCEDHRRHLVLISHDERDLTPLCSYQIVIENGQIAAHGEL